MGDVPELFYNNFYDPLIICVPVYYWLMNWEEGIFFPAISVTKIHKKKFENKGHQEKYNKNGLGR